MDIAKHFHAFVFVKKYLKFLTRFLMSGLIKTHLLRTENILKRVVPIVLYNIYSRPSL